MILIALIILQVQFDNIGFEFARSYLEFGGSDVR